MAGKPFGAELIRAIRSTPVFVPVVTLPSLRRMAAAADAGAEADMSLAEALTALYFRSTGDIRLIHPLLVADAPPPADPSSLAALPRWSPLNKQREYEEVLDALPDAVPVATQAAVNAALRAAGEPGLPPHFAALSVRDIMRGRPQPGDAAGAPGVEGGLLSGPALFALDCLPQDLGLYIRDRYAPPAIRAAAEAACTRQQTAANDLA